MFLMKSEQVDPRKITDSTNTMWAIIGAFWQHGSKVGWNLIRVPFKPQKWFLDPTDRGLTRPDCTVPPNLFASLKKCLTTISLCIDKRLSSKLFQCMLAIFFRALKLHLKMSFQTNSVQLPLFCVFWQRNGCVWLRFIHSFTIHTLKANFHTIFIHPPNINLSGDSFATFHENRDKLMTNSGVSKKLLYMRIFQLGSNHTIKVTLHHFYLCTKRNSDWVFEILCTHIFNTEQRLRLSDNNVVHFTGA